MPYNEAIIEDIPISWLEYYVGWNFPNHLEFKPTLPKWWKNMEASCWDDKCGNKYFLRDVNIRDPFINESKFCGAEYYVRHNCPKCKGESFTRMLLFDILKDQIMNHIATNQQTEL